MKAIIIEIEREEITPGIFRRKMWSIVPVDQLTFEDTQEFCNRTDEMWPQRDVIQSHELKKIEQDKKNRPDRFFESLSMPPQKDKFIVTDFSNN